MKFYYNLIIIFFLSFLLVQCDIIKSSDDPAEPDRFDPDILLNNIQLSTREFYSEAALFGGQLTRMRYMFGDTYGNAYQPQTFNSIYETAYSSIFLDISNLRDMAELQNLSHHENLANILQANIMITLVDLFGDMPYSETILGLDKLSPAIDDAEFIYKKAIELLDEAILNLESNEDFGFVPTDLYFGFLANPQAQKNAWIRTANTIKLKAFLNMGDARSFNELAESGNLILTADQNFQFNYSSGVQSAESRHPMFAANYVSLASDYMANNYMNMLLNDKSDKIDRDPRIRYYFYRQTLDEPNQQLKNCITSTKPFHYREDDPYCHLKNGYWGRDHLIADGIPPDAGHRTVPGVYPAGGQYDASQGESVNQNMGFRGAGFEPILISAFTHFMIAEAELTLNNNPDNARSSLEEGIRQSLELVRDFGSTQASGLSGEITEDKIDEYIDIVLNRWDSSETDRLRNIAKEYYLALWPNGYEAYNLMRRTGYPNRQDNLQPARTQSPGNWYRTVLYPAVMVNRNANASQKSSSLVRTFWDNRGNTDEFNF